MLQEGYMMKTGDIAGTQHEFREKLVNTIGEALTDSFYMVWLRDHCTRTDIDSLASWGFNSVRVAMHYKWFTLPIEEEPIAGSHTWLDIGFALIDSLLDWCGDNEMYLILDLHGAPGGQGANASISDYDPSKPSLWESQENKDKTVALWKRLAERYRDEPWMGGYDLINETNWTFPEGNNSQLRNLFVRITDSIRTVDQNHMIIIEGNWFANDYSGLTPPWDPNLVYSFHKYWSFNDPGSIDWMLNLRDTYNIPIWLGESGENSNTWFTNLISLCEARNIGWSWWPLKKGGINNPLRVEINDDYLQLIDNWRGTGPFLSPEEAFQAVLTFSDRHSIENCYFQKDVVDAMIRQPHTTETLPFVNRTVQDTLFAPEYDLGRNGFAYFDTDTADYHGDMDGTYIEWNSGHAFRNDGVDLEPCEDAVSNGYNVGWTSDGEWLSYTLVNDSSAAYTMEVRSASAGSGARIHVEVNGLDASGPVDLPATGGWQKWVTSEIEDIILPEGQVRISIVIDRGGSNLNFFRFTTPRPDSLLPFRALSAVTSVLENELQITLNKPVTSTPSFEISDFSLAGGGVEKPIESVSLGGEEGRVLTVISSAPLFYNESLRVTWAGEGILHGEQPLTPFSYLEVQNRLARHFQVPVRIQAEDYYLNRGLELESCSDIGGGLNTGYANVGDYLDYVLYVPQAGDYSLDFRIATERYNAGLQILKKGADRFEILGNMRFDRTGGWQNWTTQSTSLSLGEGKYLIRLMVTGEEHNLNWFEFRQPVSAETQAATGSFLIFPNPASARTIFLLKTAASGQARLNIFDSMGRLVFSEPFQGERMEMDISDWQTGVYLVRMDTGDDMQPGKLIVQPSY
ncbi:MAG TPA: carbohydrate-binding protein [Bacteroides sp.]|nr:carbohydrate-binding protein [Bacteroides sp.]